MTNRPQHHSDAICTLSRVALWVCVGVPVAMFLLWDDPIFGNPFDIDRSILGGYAVVPFIVAIALAVERKLGLKAWLVDSLMVSIYKFALTYPVAIALWAVAGAPPARPPIESVVQVPAQTLQVRAPKPSLIHPEETEDRSGFVLNESGHPVAGALVYVSEIPDLHFAPPQTTRMRSSHAPDQGLQVIQTHQPVVFEVDSTSLHTVFVRTDRGIVLHKPVPPTGGGAEVVFVETHGWLEVLCQVHPDAKPLAMLVVDHPFWTRSDASGRFVLKGVPKTARSVLSRDEAGRPLQVTVEQHPT